MSKPRDMGLFLAYLALGAVLIVACAALGLAERLGLLIVVLTWSGWVQ